jgi:putative ABC transport system permease protein
MNEPLWRRYLRFFRGSVEGDIDDELRFHFDSRIAELISQGVAPDAARSKAEDEFGSTDETRRRLRDIDRRIEQKRERWEWLTGLWLDLKYSARSLGRAPIVAATVVVTLALGLGANVAMFSLLDVLYLRYPASVEKPEEVQRVWQQMLFSNSGLMFWSGYAYPQYLSMQSVVGDDAALALYNMPARTQLRGAHEGTTAWVSHTSASYFPVLGVRAARGRLYGEEESRMGSPVRVIVLSDQFWRSRFGASDSTLGRAIRIGNDDYSIIGVAPPQFTGVEINTTDMWIPLAARPSRTRWWEDFNVNGFQVILRPRASLDPDVLTPRLAIGMRPEGMPGMGKQPPQVAAVSSLIRARGPGRVDQAVRLAARLSGVALLVLLIAIANVVNLLLARALQRRREIAVRLALGISRARLLRLLVSESVLLSIMAVTAAVLTAVWGGGLLRAVLLPDVQWTSAPLHWRVLLFTGAIAIVAGAITGLIPSLQSLNPDLTDSLKSGSRSTTSARSSMRTWLVVAQAAMSLILLVGAGLFLKSLSNIKAHDIGFDADQLTFGSVSFPVADTARDRVVAAEMGTLAARLRARPGVDHVALSVNFPILAISFETFFIEADTARNKPATYPTFTAVSPEYFDAVGLRFVDGAGFPADGAPTQSVVINQTMARGYFGPESPVGRCMRFEKPTAPCYRIVGVVENAIRSDILEKPTAQYYLPLHSMPMPGWRAGAVIVRSHPSARAAVADEITSTVQTMFPGSRVSLRTMTDVLDRQYRPWRLGATLFTLFGVLALVVAMIGIYSTVSYSVNQRLHEFGVRMALGAHGFDLVSHVVRGALTVVAAGVGIGIAASIAGGELVASLLYGVQPWDPAIITVVALFLLAVAAIAALGPAWRAARVNPVKALQAD